MPLTSFVRATAGGAVGALLGYLGFRLLLSQGFYALAIPGAGLGLGCGIAASGSSPIRMAVCGVLGTLLGIFTEWQFFPFVDDDSLGYFLTHLHQLRGLTLLMIVLGGGFAAGLSRGRNVAAGQRPPGEPR